MGNDTYRVMITSLYGGGPKDVIDYYNVRQGERYMYCDAILSAEASCKYILANYDIDTIVTLGSKSTYDPGDELVEMVIREGSSFYASDINKLSAYSLLRYRLAQFLDEIRIEEQDIRDLLTEEEQQKTIDAVKNSFRKLTQGDPDAKFNRFFDMLDRDENLKIEFTKEVIGSLGTENARLPELRKWILNYLYSEMRDSSKMEPLEVNSDVTISFIPTHAGKILEFASRLSQYLIETAKSGNYVNYEIFVCIQSEDADDTYNLMNFMDLIRVMPGNRVKVTKVVTSAHDPGEVASEITDSTELYGVSELLAGTRSFLGSGKTDILTHYWNVHRTDNEYIDRLLSAMRRIDIGISLCDISDIERGIMSLRKLFGEAPYEPGDSIAEQYFGFIVAAIKEDYGRLLEGDRIEMIDLVRWAYSKGFWQQTLTLIESKAPDDFVEKGIYYYANSDESKENATRIFGEIYYDLKPFEKYKLDDLSHYFVKFYARGRVGHPATDDEHAQKYAKIRLEDLHTDNKKTIRAFTDCPDEDALGNLLYAYYLLGFVRNSTNHAIGDSGEFSLVMKDNDVSERLNLIKKTIESFIDGYDKVISLTKDGGHNVRLISNDEIRAFARTLKPKFNKYDDRKDRDNKGGDHKDGNQGNAYHKAEGQRDNADKGKEFNRDNGEKKTFNNNNSNQ